MKKHDVIKEIPVETSGWLTTNPTSPQAGAFAGYQAGTTTATWKYRTSNTSWPDSFSMMTGAQDWSQWTGPAYTTSNGPFSTTTTAIVLQQGDKLYVSAVPGGGTVYLRRKAANDFVFYTTLSIQYLPTGRYDFTVTSTPGGQFHFGEDAPQ